MRSRFGIHKSHSPVSPSNCDEDSPQKLGGVSDVGNMNQPTTVTRPSSQTIDKVKNKVWRRSHSLGAVRAFMKGVRGLDRYLEKTGESYGNMLADPYRGLDCFAEWLDEDHAPSMTRQYITYVKKLLTADGAIIDRDRFKEQVVLPLQVPFDDDKVSEEQIRRILMATKNQKLKVVLMLMKDAPIRPIEVLGSTLRNFNLDYDPPYLVIPSHLAKSKVPRETFFTHETKQILQGYLKRMEIVRPEQYVFIRGSNGMYDELQFQESVIQKVSEMSHVLREQVLSRAEFADMNQRVENTRGKAVRYKIHLYSFKKFSFTKVADTLGELAAQAMKGDKKYVLTYYKKSREERATDYKKVIPKVSIFSTDEKYKLREQVNAQVNALDDETLARLQEFLRTARTQPDSCVT